MISLEVFSSMPPINSSVNSDTLLTKDILSFTIFIYLFTYPLTSFSLSALILFISLFTLFLPYINTHIIFIKSSTNIFNFLYSSSFNFKSFLDMLFALLIVANIFLILIKISFLVSETLINLFNTLSPKFRNLPISLLLSSSSSSSSSLVHGSFSLVHGSFSLVHGSFSLVHTSSVLVHALT